MTRRRIFWPVVVLALAGTAVLWAYPPRWGIRTLPVYDPKDGRSGDLATDLKLMWETEPLGRTTDPSHGPDPHAPTDRAINAASRVFNTVEFVGKTRDEVVTLLGAPKTSSNSTYNFPFWPAPRRVLVYRFDCGSRGWQFNVVFGLWGRVTGVERLWIH